MTVYRELKWLQRSFLLMSDKQLEKLLEGFVQSSRCLSSLQEGILDLHGVMEQFQQATEEFNLKNEIDTLLPTVKEHFVKVNDMYRSIGGHLTQIKEQTVEIEITGREMVPAYQKLQLEVTQLQDMQGEMVGTIREVNGSVLAMQETQRELQLQMIELRQMMMESKQMQGELLEAVGKK